jgi:copper chaperone
MSLQFKVPDMACAACADTITQAVVALDPTAKVAADPQTKRVVVETQTADQEIKAAITAAGYTVTD